MSGKTSRTKGHSFERKTAQDFATLFPEARRHLEYQDGEADGVDLKNTGPFLVQCKRGKAYAPITAIEEIQMPKDSVSNVPVGLDANGSIVYKSIPLKLYPMLITKADHKPTMAVMQWEDLLELIRNAYDFR